MRSRRCSGGPVVVLIVPTRDCNATVRAFDSATVRSSSSLRGIATRRPRLLAQHLSAGPHRPYEGLQLVGGVELGQPGQVLIVPTRDCNCRSPPGLRPATPGPHRPYEGLQLDPRVGVPALRTRPHRPYEGLQPALIVVETALVTCPHRPYEGLQRVWMAEMQERLSSSSSLRGIATVTSKALVGPLPTGPHRPYEGLQPRVARGRHRRVRESSSSLRGIATTQVPGAGVPGGARSSSSLRGIATSCRLVSGSNGRRRPHRPYEGLQPAGRLRVLRPARRPHRPYEGLQPDRR